MSANRARSEATTYFEALSGAVDELFKVDEQMLAALESLLTARIAGFQWSQADVPAAK